MSLRVPFVVAVQISFVALIFLVPVSASPHGVWQHSGVPTGPVLSTSPSNSNLTLLATVGAGICPTAAGYDSGTNEVYIGNSCSNNVTVISGVTDRVDHNISTHPDPEWATYDSGKKEMFIADSSDSKVDFIPDANHSVVRYVTVNAAYGLVYDAARGEVFVADPNLNQVVVISDTTNSSAAVIGVGGGPGGIAYDSLNGRIFVTNYGSNNLSVISDTTNTVVGTVNLTVSPYDATFDPNSGDVYVTSSYGVTVVSGATSSVIGSVPGMGTATAITDGANAGEVFVASRGGGNVTAISTATNTIAQVVNVGNGPDAIAYDSANGYVYTANYLDGTASIVGAPGPQKFGVTFTESGLPNGAGWTVSLNGSSQRSTGTTDVFAAPNGTYAFTIPTVPGYSARPSTGSLTVAGAPVGQAIEFSLIQAPSYPVNFTETGLPSGTSWSVTLGGAPQTSTTATVSFSEINGSYAYLVSATGYSAVPAVGTLQVNGQSLSEPVAFTVRPPSEYAATVTENGLPAGSNWSATLGGQTVWSTTGAITFQEQNGSYPYSVTSIVSYAPVPSTGSITVAGGPTSSTVTFYELFPLSFTESALPAGSNWSVTLSSTTAVVIQIAGAATTTLTKWSEGATSVDFRVPNGTFSYTTGATGFNGTASTLTVNGVAPAAVQVGFTSSTTGVPTGGGSSSGTPLVDWIIIGAVLVVVMVGVALALLSRGRKNSPPPGSA